MDSSAGARQGILLASIRSFFVGGSNHTVSGLPVRQRRLNMGAGAREVDLNGDYVAGQMYVQHYQLAQARRPYPVVLVHGGGMTGAQWESTPDGRSGWLWAFLRAGHDVFVCDAVERGRSSWAMYPEIYKEPPIFRSKNEAWHLFRVGPQPGYSSRESQRIAHPGQRFPVTAFDEFAKQWVPRWAGHEELSIAAYRQLVERVGACVIVAHSQGASFAAAVAQSIPDGVKAVVAIEPAGVPARVCQGLPPHLAIWGDFIDQHPVWSDYRQLASHHWAACAAAGSPFDEVDLPTQGVRGNSHFLMLDNNSDDIARTVVDWLSTHAS